MSLKSEVATIDRRRKRLKKKDREGELEICFMSPMRGSFVWKCITQSNLSLTDDILERKESVTICLCMYLERIIVAFWNLNLTETFANSFITV